MARTANVYIDGFNLYYGCVKNTPYRWLNLSKLCGRLIPDFRVRRIRYFTALVHTRDDPGSTQRQLVYLRALRTIPNLTVHYGLFATHEVNRPLAGIPDQGTKMVRVLDTKEKGSDVNLATYLLVDGFKKEADFALVISNDSDLVEPIRLAGSELGLEVGIWHPHSEYVKDLAKVAVFYRRIKIKGLQDSLFPTTLSDSEGTITKPSSW